MKGENEGEVQTEGKPRACESICTTFGLKCERIHHTKFPLFCDLGDPCQSSRKIKMDRE